MIRHPTLPVTLAATWLAASIWTRGATPLGRQPAPERAAARPASE
ncbi:hypothetical protein ACIBCB_18450 [Streptomyces uncialis]